MQWFRFYIEALRDPKVQNLPPYLFRMWVNLLCLAGETDRETGALPDLKTTAFALRMRPERCRAGLASLVDRGLIDASAMPGDVQAVYSATPGAFQDNAMDGGLVMHKWPSRQYKSDDVTARVKRFRNVTVTPPETETDHRDRSDQIPVGPAAPSPVERFYAAEKTNEEVAALCDEAMIHGRKLDGGRLAAMLRKHPKTAVMDALTTALGRNAAGIEDYMAGVLKNKRNGRTPPSTAFDAADVREGF